MFKKLKEILKRKHKEENKSEKVKKELGKAEKKKMKKFFSSDFIERMVRIEQKVSASFGEHIPYKETEYYKSLSEKEKRDFDKYMKNKGKKRVLFSLLLISIMVSAIFLMNGKFVGFAIKENIGERGFKVTEILLILTLIVIIIEIILTTIFRGKKRKRFEEHFSVFENILKKRKI